MTQCCAPDCKNQGRHKFPKDPKRRKSWEKSLRIKNFKASEHSVLCSAHFTADDYFGQSIYNVYEPKAKFLKKTAVPSIFSFTKTKVESISAKERLERLEKRCPKKLMLDDVPISPQESNEEQETCLSSLSMEIESCNEVEISAESEENHNPTLVESVFVSKGNEAKKAWEKLRNNHRDALRRQSKPKAGSGAANIRPWRFQENMAFLIPHMANRYTHTSEEIHIDDTSQDARDNDIQENLSEEEESRTNEETNQSSGRISTVKVNKRWRQNRLNKSMDEHQRVAKRQREREIPTTNDFTVNNAKNDPLFHFFMSMYETTKRLPPLSQHTIKTSVFSCVSQEESKNLIQDSPGPHSSSTPGPYFVSYTPSPVQQTNDSLPAETVAIIKQESPEINAEGSGNMFAYAVDPFN